MCYGLFCLLWGCLWLVCSLFSTENNSFRSEFCEEIVKNKKQNQQHWLVQMILTESWYKRLLWLIKLIWLIWSETTFGIGIYHFIILLYTNIILFNNNSTFNFCVSQTTKIVVYFFNSQKKGNITFLVFKKK